MKFLLIYLSLIVAINGELKAENKINCNIHKLYCAIIDLQPAINKGFAMELSNVLYKKSKKHNIDPYISIAIAMQESSLLNINRSVEFEKKVLKTCDEYLKCETLYKKINYISDFGLFQFSLSSVKERNINVERLLNDVEYMVEEHMVFLKEKINMCKSRYPETSWACWHSASFDHHYNYVDKVNKYYRGSK